jgi:hypothetical protein
MKSRLSRSKSTTLAMLVGLSLAIPASVSAQRAVPRGDGGRQSSGGSGGNTSPAPHGGARPSSPRSTSGRAEAPPPERVSGRAAGEADASSSDGSVAGARPRHGDRVTGTAVTRSSRPPSGGNTIIVGDHYPYHSYGYYPYYPWGYGIGLGFGYGAFGFGYGGLGYDSWYGYPAYGYPAYGYPAYGYPAYGYGYPGVYAPASGFPGGLRIRVAPSDATVYVDGYYAGEVDDFDNTFQRLRLDPGTHRIEVRKDGYEPLNFEVRVQPDQTVTYKGKLKKL